MENNTLFWNDKRIMACSVEDLVLIVEATVPSRVRNQRLVAQALPDQIWSQDIQCHLSMIGLFELFQLADVLADFILSQEEDAHV